MATGGGSPPRRQALHAAGSPTRRHGYVLDGDIDDDVVQGSPNQHSPDFDEDEATYFRFDDIDAALDEEWKTPPEVNNKQPTYLEKFHRDFKEDHQRWRSSRPSRQTREEDIRHTYSPDNTEYPLFRGPPNFLQQMQTLVDKIENILEHTAFLVNEVNQPVAFHNCQKSLNYMKELRDLYNTSMVDMVPQMYNSIACAIEHLTTVTTEEDMPLEMLVKTADELVPLATFISKLLQPWHESYGADRVYQRRVRRYEREQRRHEGQNKMQAPRNKLYKQDPRQPPQSPQK